MPDDRPIDPTDLVVAQLGELQAIPGDDWTEGPIGDLGLRYQQLTLLAAFVDNLVDEIGQTLADSMETELLPLPGGVGRLRREERLGSAWKSKHSAEQLREDLTAAVARVVAVDIATGEVDPMKRNIAVAAMRTALETIPSFSTLLKAGRERLGLRMGDYRDFSTYYRVIVEPIDYDDH